MATKKTSNKKIENKIYSVLSSIDTRLKKQNSIQSIFRQGIIRGFGYALGATIILTILTSLTYKLINYFDLSDFIGNFFNDSIQ